MPELIELARLVVQILGPLMLACIIVMFISVTLSYGRPPKPAEVVYLYVKNSIAKRRHAGVMTYLLVVSSFFFVIAAAVLLADYAGLLG